MSTTTETFDTITERLLLVIFTIASAYAYIEAESFTGQVGQFPRLLSSTILIGSLLLLVRDYLPEPLYSIVAESNSLVSEASADEVPNSDHPAEDDTYGDSDVEDLEAPTASDESSDPEPYTSVSDKLRYDQALHEMLFTACATVGYVGLSYLIGMLFASPIFIIVYGLWFDVSKKAIAFLALLSIAVIWGFITMLYIPLDEGILFGGIA